MENTDFEKLVADRDAFNKTVYIPVEQAIVELEKRWKDKELEKKIKEYLKHDLHHSVVDGFKAVLFRQLVTPNYELRRFMMVPDALDIKPVFWEIHNDKFTLNNDLKYYLAKLGFYEGKGKKGGSKIKYESIIDFNQSHGKKVKEVETVWGEPLLDFHHQLFSHTYPNETANIHDVSEWLHRNEQTAKEYYKDVLVSFLRNAILFENFILTGSEGEFIKDVFLPTFFDIWKTFGIKPLIVALEPTDIEGDVFWLCHPPETVEHVRKKHGKKSVSFQ